MKNVLALVQALFRLRSHPRRLKQEIEFNQSSIIQKKNRNNKPFSIGAVSTILAVVSGVTSATGRPIGAIFGFHDMEV